MTVVESRYRVRRLDMNYSWVRRPMGLRRQCAESPVSIKGSKFQGASSYFRIEGIGFRYIFVFCCIFVVFQLKAGSGDSLNYFSHRSIFARTLGLIFCEPFWLNALFWELANSKSDQDNSVVYCHKPSTRMPES